MRGTPGTSLVTARDAWAQDSAGGSGRASGRSSASVSRLRYLLLATIFALVGFLLFWTMSLALIPDVPILPKPLGALALFGWLACFGLTVWCAVQADTWE